MVKEIEIGQAHESTPVETATCDLILQGKNFGRRHAPYMAYYAYVSAHLILEDKDCRDLLNKDVMDAHVEIKREEINGKAGYTNYYLELPETEKRLTLLSAPIQWNYRHYRQSQLQTTSSNFDWYLNDSALLEIDGRELLTEEDSVISLPELTSAMKIHKDGIELREILPINDNQILITMAKENVRVKIGGVSGFMVPPGWCIDECRSLQSIEEKQQQWYPDIVEDQQDCEDAFLTENYQRDRDDFGANAQQSKEDQQLLYHIQFVLYDRQEHSNVYVYFFLCVCDI